MEHTERMEPTKANDASDFDTELSKTLSAALASRQQVSFSSRDEFSDWLRQGQEKRNRQRRRSLITGTAACAAVFACAFLVWSSGLISDVDGRALLPWNDAPTYASSEKDSSITEESGSIVIGGDGNGNVGEFLTTYTSYADLPEKYQAEIVWFEEIPAGYELEGIEIGKGFNSCLISTIFSAPDGSNIYCKQFNAENDSQIASVINECDETLCIDNEYVYVTEDNTGKTYASIQQGHRIDIYAPNNLPEKAIEAMIASIKTGWNM